MDSVAASPREYLVRRPAKNVISPPEPPPKKKQLPKKKQCKIVQRARAPRAAHAKKLHPNTAVYKPWSNYFPVLLCATKLAQSTSQYYFVLQSLHKLPPITTVYYKACTKHVPVLLCTTTCTKYFPVLLCTTKLAQSISQYYFVLQSLHKVFSSTTVYYQ